MLDERFDPAFALLFSETDCEVEDFPPPLAVIAVSSVVLAIAAALCWPLT